MDDDVERILTQDRRAPNPRSAQDVLELAERRQRDAEMVRLLGGGMAAGFTLIFLGLLLLPRLQPADLTMKGAGASADARLTWVVEADGASPHLADEIRPGERVIFGVEGTATGFACIDERGPAGWTRVLPPSGRNWAVAPGRAVFSVDGHAQAFITDLGPGTHTYRLLVHPDDPSCQGGALAGEVGLRWIE